MKVDVVVEAPGRRTVRKVAETPEEAARVRREADLIDVAGHPGLVEVVDFADGGAPELRTAYVGESLAAAAGSLKIEELAGAVAAVAATLADLHDLGLVHGAVEAAHVLLDGGGRPVLCGLGSGGLAGERSPGGRALDPADDVAGLGALILFLVEGSAGAAATELRRIAAEASAGGGPSVSAHQVAGAVHDSIPEARLPGGGAAGAGRPADDVGAVHRRTPLDRWRQAQRAGSSLPPGGGAARPRWAWLPAASAVALAVALAGVALVLVLRPSASPPPDQEARLPATPPPTARPATTFEGPTTTLAAVRRPSPPPIRPGCPAVGGPMTADVDGDGCADSVRYSAGVAEAAGRRWSVGEAGDVAAVGDWSCSGARSLAVLRPRTGEVFAFSGWATSGQDLTGPRVGEVAGGTGLRAGDLDGDGCNELIVERGSGAPAVVRLPRATP